MEEEDVVKEKNSKTYLSIPYGIQSVAFYDYSYRHCDIQSITHNPRLNEYVLLDTRGVSSWTNNAEFNSTRRLYDYPPYKFNLLKSIFYCKTLMLYFVVTKHYKMQVYTNNFSGAVEVGNSDIRVSAIMFNYKLNEVVTIGINRLCFWRMEIIPQLGGIRKKLIQLNREYLVDGVTMFGNAVFDEELQRVYLMCDYEIWCYSVKGEKVFKINYNMTFTTCVFSPPANLFVTAVYTGAICIFSTSGGLVKELGCHSKEVTSILLHPSDPNITISAALDGTIKLVCLNTLTQLYSITSKVTKVLWLGLSKSTFYCASTQKIEIFDLNYSYKFWNLSRTAAKSIKLTPNMPFKTTQVLFKGDDNSVRIYEQNTGTNKCNILPPPELSLLKKVKSVAYDRIGSVTYMLSCDCKYFWIYTTKTNPATRVSTWEIDLFLQQEYKKEKGLNFTAIPDHELCNCLATLKRHVPPEKLYVSKYKNKYRPPKLSFLLCGLSNGAILCIDPYLGVKHYYEVIQRNSSILEIETSSGTIITLHETQNEKCLRFSDATTLHQLYAMTMPCEMTVYRFKRPYLAIGCSSGHVGIKCYGDVQTFSTSDTNLDMKDHAGAILSVDLLEDQQLLCSCGADEFIRIWNFNKVLLAEIRLDGTLSCAAFLDSSGSVVFSFKSNLYVISGKKLKIDSDFDKLAQNQESFIFENPEKFMSEQSEEVTTLTEYLDPYPQMKLQKLWKLNLTREDEEEIQAFDEETDQKQEEESQGNENDQAAEGEGHRKLNSCRKWFAKCRTPILTMKKRDANPVKPAKAFEKQPFIEEGRGAPTYEYFVGARAALKREDAAVAKEISSEELPPDEEHEPVEKKKQPPHRQNPPVKIIANEKSKSKKSKTSKTVKRVKKSEASSNEEIMDNPVTKKQQENKGSVSHQAQAVPIITEQATEQQSPVTNQRKAGATKNPDNIQNQSKKQQHLNVNTPVGGYSRKSLQEAAQKKYDSSLISQSVRNVVTDLTDDQPQELNAPRESSVPRKSTLNVCASSRPNSAKSVHSKKSLVNMKNSRYEHSKRSFLDMKISNCEVKLPQHIANKNNTESETSGNVEIPESTINSQSLIKQQPENKEETPNINEVRPDQINSENECAVIIDNQRDVKAGFAGLSVQPVTFNRRRVSPNRCKGLKNKSKALRSVESLPASKLREKTSLYNRVSYLMRKRTTKSFEELICPVLSFERTKSEAKRRTETISQNPSLENASSNDSQQPKSQHKSELQSIDQLMKVENLKQFDKYDVGHQRVDKIKNENTSDTLMHTQSFTEIQDFKSKLSISIHSNAKKIQESSKITKDLKVTPYSDKKTFKNIGKTQILSKGDRNKTNFRAILLALRAKNIFLSLFEKTREEKSSTIVNQANTNNNKVYLDKFEESGFVVTPASKSASPLFGGKSVEKVVADFVVDIFKKPKCEALLKYRQSKNEAKEVRKKREAWNRSPTVKDSGFAVHRNLFASLDTGGSSPTPDASLTSNCTNHSSNTRYHRCGSKSSGYGSSLLEERQSNVQINCYHINDPPQKKQHPARPKQRPNLNLLKLGRNLAPLYEYETPTSLLPHRTTESNSCAVCHQKIDKLEKRLSGQQYRFHFEHTPEEMQNDVIKLAYLKSRQRRGGGMGLVPIHRTSSSIPSKTKRPQCFKVVN